MTDSWINKEAGWSPQPLTPTWGDWVIPVLADNMKQGLMDPYLYKGTSLTNHGVSVPELTPYFVKAGGQVLDDNGIIQEMRKGTFGTGQDQIDYLHRIGLTDADIARNQAAIKPTTTVTPKTLLDTPGLVSYIMAGKAGNGPKRIQHLLGLGYSPEQVLAAQKVINRSMRKVPAPIPIKAPPTTPAQVPVVTSTPKPEAQLAASLFRARQQSARNALGGLSPAEGVQRGIIPYEALAYF